MAKVWQPTGRETERRRARLLRHVGLAGGHVLVRGRVGGRRGRAPLGLRAGGLRLGRGRLRGAQARLQRLHRVLARMRQVRLRRQW